jgi:hypothetical protein
MNDKGLINWSVFGKSAKRTICETVIDRLKHERGLTIGKASKRAKKNEIDAEIELWEARLEQL